jgi:hypothetical protein
MATYHLQERLWEVWVRQDAPIAGTPLEQVAIGRRYGLSVISLLRDGRQQPADDVVIGLQGKDVLLVGGRREKVEQLCAENEGLVLAGPPEPQTAFPSSEAELVEVIVPPRSHAIGDPRRLPARVSGWCPTNHAFRHDQILAACRRESQAGVLRTTRSATHQILAACRREFQAGVLRTTRSATPRSSPLAGESFRLVSRIPGTRFGRSAVGHQPNDLAGKRRGFLDANAAHRP